MGLVILSRSFAGAALLAILVLLTLSGMAAAAPSISVHGYVPPGGSYTPVAEGGTIPTGSTLRLRIYIDLSSCGSVRVGWGDGTPAETRDYGGALVQDWPHVFNKEGTYGIVATDCGGSDGATITVENATALLGGGTLGLGPLDPDGAVFVPTIIGLVLGLVGLALANARVPAVPTPAGGASWHKHLKPLPVGASQSVVSLRDIPLGAVRLDWPENPRELGKPTDPFYKPVCKRCAMPLGYTVAGWFCLNPACAAPGAEKTLFPQVGEPYGAADLKAPPV